MRAENLRRLAGVRERILDRAEILPGETVLDVGTGQGLLGLAALDRTGEAGHVIFSDVSDPSLDDCRAEVAQRSALDRSSFVHASATDLSSIPTASVDVIVERAVLLFIEDRRRAFEEYHRVLRAGGRLSIGEPLNIWMGADRPGYRLGVRRDRCHRPRAKAPRRLSGADGEATGDLLCGFDDRDLIAMAHDAGFQPDRRPDRSVPGSATCSRRSRRLSRHGSEPAGSDDARVDGRGAEPGRGGALHRGAR